MPRIYLDHLAASPLLSEVREAMLPYFNERFGSPSSFHQEALAARDAVKQARQEIAALLHADATSEVVFTGSPAEAINLAIKGAALGSRRPGKHIVLSTAEQPAVAQTVEALEKQGFTATRVPVDHFGKIDANRFSEALREDTVLTCVHHANLDIGTIQPIAAIGERTSEKAITLFVDATASAGWIPLDVQSAKIDLLAAAPHRFFGPKGIGLLYRSRRTRIAPLIHGLGLDDAENVPAIVGAGKAAELAARELSAREERTRNLQTAFLAELTARVPHIQLNGPPPGSARLPNSLNISIEFVEGEGLALMLDVRGVAVSSGAACVTKTMRIPPVLAAIGLPETLAKGNVIVSFGLDNTRDEIGAAAAIFAKAVAALREMSPLWEDFQNGSIKSETETHVERGLS